MTPVTVLRCTGSCIATKQWEWHAQNNIWIPISYQAGTWFEPAEYQINSLSDLVGVLEIVSRDPKAFIVTGALTPEALEEMRGANRPIRRLKYKRNGLAPSLVERPGRWIVIDIDRFRLRASDDLAADPEAAIEYAISELLPPAFHDAVCWWQLSSSAGFVRNILKVHLFFWLDEPATNEHIKAVLKQHAPGVDRAPFSAAQPIFIASPIIIGAPDPIPRRTGWRKGINDTVTLPPLLRRSFSATDTTRTGNTNGGGGGFSHDGPGFGHGGPGGYSIESDLALLGDGDGKDGFHAVLRSATLHYARQHLDDDDDDDDARDDPAFHEQLRAAIQAAPRQADRDLNGYLSHEYLTRLTNGAFTWWRGVNDASPTPMPPYHEAAADPLSAHDARIALDTHIKAFLGRAQGWHAKGGSKAGKPEQAALAASLGSGKSSRAREALRPFIAAMRKARLPWRVLWTVPYHRLGADAAAAMQALGLNVAIWRGRDQHDPDADDPDANDPDADDPDANDPKILMCLDPKAVDDGIKIHANIEQDICRGCPFFDACGYQKQKAAVARADIVIAAHNILFYELPKAIEKNLGLVITDEAWWQIGLKSGVATQITSFNEDLFSAPVLRDPDARRGLDGKKKRPPGARKRQADNPSDTSALHELATKARHAFEATPEGHFVSREAVVQTGLTAEDCDTASRLEWRRKIENVLTGGMTPDDRRAAIKKAWVNATIPRRAGIWRALKELLDGTETETGRLEAATQSNASGSHPVILLHNRERLSAQVLARPILVLDATLRETIVRYYLPSLTVLANIHVASPYAATFIVPGPWGKTSLIPNPEATTETGEKENQRRERRLRELADLVGFHGGRNSLTITHKDIEGRFRVSEAGAETGHFGAIVGLDQFKDVRTLFVIGRPLPKPEVIHLRALALTGKPIRYETSRKEGRGQLMADGQSLALQVRAYDNPDLEMVRAAITDDAVIQATGRGRAVNRTASNPLAIIIFADVVMPMPVKAIPTWKDVRLSPFQRMAARGLAVENATDAASLYRDLFPTREAAKKASQREGGWGHSPMNISFIGECPQPRLVGGHYRRIGVGHKNQRLWVADWFLSQARKRLEAAIGPLVQFELDDQTPPPPP